MSQCTAKSKRTGQRCEANAMHGRNVCYHHGGKTPRGFDLPQSKTLKYSAYLPDRLAVRYAEMEADPDLLTLKRQTALVNVRLTELMSRIDDGLGSQALTRIDDAFRELRAAMAAQDKLKTESAFFELGDSINAAKADFAVWADIYQAITVLTRTSESERKRLVEADYMVKLDEVMNFVGALAGIVRETIKDREQVTIITNKMQRLLETNYGND